MTRLLLVGGFLGAGKTTLLLQAARHLADRGLRTAMVTNDQGTVLVDTALANQQHVPVFEVAGGCFCCRFPDLLAGLHHLQATVAPDVILAEPVGSCTDLMATVLRPLLAHPDNRHGAPFEIAPLTVLLDATRSLAGYSDTVGYLYHKQIAEAEIIALSKADLLDAAGLAATTQRLEKLHSPVQVHTLSARTGIGMASWLDHVMTHESEATKRLEIDYQRYAEAEAQLGWLNTRGTIRAGIPFSAKNWINHFLRLFDEALIRQLAAIAHLKIQVTSGAAQFKASITQSGAVPSWDLCPAGGSSDCMHFVLNARVNTTPPILERVLRHTFAAVTPEPDFQYEFTHFECFGPLPPQPTYRMDR